MLLIGVSYAIVGVATAAFARSAPSTQLRTFWRLAAWLLSFAIFVTHIAYEHLRLRSTVRQTAVHAAVAVALGAFLLAAMGPVRTHWGTAEFWRVSVLSLALWPVLTGVPAFLAALIGASILRRVVGGGDSASSASVI